MMAIYNSRNYRSILAGFTAPWLYRNLQQQKLQKHTSHIKRETQSIRIYNSRNYRSILAILVLIIRFYSSTIVEIIEAYQPGKYEESPLSDLQQQKLQKHTSQVTLLTVTYYIYNSRNYRSILAFQTPVRFLAFIYNSRNYRSILAYGLYFISLSSSTIVEIIEAYQPCNPKESQTSLSTIVEIIEVTRHL